MTPVVLASKSVVRRRLLAAAGVPFEAAESGVDEAIRKAGLTARTPEVIAETLAEAKALQASTAFRPTPWSSAPTRRSTSAAVCSTRPRRWIRRAPS